MGSVLTYEAFGYKRALEPAERGPRFGDRRGGRSAAGSIPAALFHLLVWPGVQYL